MVVETPTPIGPARKPPSDAILFGFDLYGGVYYKIGILVWLLKGEQWHIYGYADQWPEPLMKEGA